MKKIILIGIVMFVGCSLARGGELANVLWNIRSQVVRIETPDGGTGTGFVIDKRGYIVTNCHVVSEEGGKGIFPVVKVSVRYGPRDDEFEARIDCKVIGADPRSDLAVVWLDPRSEQLRTVINLRQLDQLVPLKWSNNFAVGDDVAAVGFPWGQSGSVSVTKGIVSATVRGLPSANPRSDGLFGGLIQTDASINPGNSGGPLLDMHGDVVGINTFEYDTMSMRPALMKLPIVDESGHAVTLPQGLGRETKLFVNVPFRQRLARGVYYARSRWTAEPVVNELIRYGHVRRGDLGIAEAMTVSRREADGMPTFSYGARIVALEKNSPLQEAGLQPGDIITRVSLSFGGFPINCIGDLNNAMVGLDPGASVLVSYRRPSAEQVEKLRALAEAQSGAISQGDLFLKLLSIENRTAQVKTR